MASSSSASGSGSGSGSLSSQSVPSSMESGSTLPNQDVVDGYFSEPEETDRGWGKLIPLGRSFELIELVKETYTFGRDINGDVCYAQKAFPRGNSSFFQRLSKKHFQLLKETSENGEHIVYIKDWSMNGTFVNGGLIGKGNQQVIQNNSEISLAALENKAYLFLDLEATKIEQEMFPQEMREKFTISKVLGRGAFGDVRLAFSKGSECNKFAIKIISKKQFSNLKTSKRDTEVSDEVDILKKLDHPCIVKVFDVVDTPESFFIVLELVEGGELFDRVVSKSKLEERIAKLLFYQMLLAVKPENVLLCSPDDETLIKITDFGVSKFVGENSYMETLCGTPSYLAPEVLTPVPEKRSYKKECDCWSLGVILYVCLSGCPPFSKQANNPLEKQVMEGSYKFPNNLWKNVSSEAKDLIRKLLTVDHRKRITVSEALEHPWIKDKEMIEKAEKLIKPTVDGRSMSPPSEKVTKRKEATDSDQSSATSSKRRKLSSDEDSTK
ncbi:serine/threonine-protein kinase Chk2-like isoform X2 [Dendronephthya gigantea]|uniref:serine/threonine-protein kinase Chk2-like isoform X2 n=1 Tax=Dendronephthya gigantea TaxID=151771 RepID=UPI00106CD408|nr:serine/threonine-protein kinase Chk2-like isoform X2 [Dendronephthya gigantea]